MIGMASAWVLRPFGGAADHALVEELWSTALEPRCRCCRGRSPWCATGSSPWTAGARSAASLDLAGSISLVLVAPGHQRRGIGADLLSAGLARLHTAGASVAHAGSGGTDYFWNP